MAHFNYTHPGDIWNDLVVLAAADMADLDSKTQRAVNGDEGGTWAPSSTIVVGGSGLQVTGTFTANNLAQFVGASSNLVSTTRTVLGTKVLIANVGTITALRSIVSSTMEDGCLVTVPGYAFFMYNASSTATDDGQKVIKPNDLGGGSPGRWLGSNYSAANVANGWASLGAAGLLPFALQQGWQIRAMGNVTGTLSFSSTTPSASLFASIDGGDATRSPRNGDWILEWLSIPDTTNMAVGGVTFQMQLAAIDFHATNVANLGALQNFFGSTPGSPLTLFGAGQAGADFVSPSNGTVYTNFLSAHAGISVANCTLTTLVIGKN